MSNKKKRFEEKKNDYRFYLYAGVLIVVILGLAAFLGFGGDDTKSPTTATNSAVQAGAAPKAGERIREVTVIPTVTPDKVIIKKSDLEKNKILKFDYEPVKLTLKSGKVPMPLMAYVTPSGKLVTAVRMCEPCNGLAFSTVNGKILNCDTCGTQWDLETTQWNGVGSKLCGSYEPEAIPHTVNGDNIEIKVNDFKDWLPRI
jgi:uncharacterized protein